MSGDTTQHQMVILRGEEERRRGVKDATEVVRRCTTPHCTTYGNWELYLKTWTSIRL
jgi:hypothetical protein